MAYRLKKLIWDLSFENGCDYSECEKRLSPEECSAVVEDLAELKCEYVIIFLGNSGLRKDTGVLTSALNYGGISYSFMSDGNCVNEKSVQIIRVMHPYSFIFCIDSVESINNNIQNSIRLLQKYKINISVVTNLTGDNHSCLNKIRTFLIDNKITEWAFTCINSSDGVTKKITAEQYFEAAEFIKNTKEKYSSEFNNVYAECFFGNDDLLSDNKYGCPAGLSSATITAEGFVKGCLALTGDNFIEGNVKTESFKRIWQSKTSFRYNRRFNMSYLDGGCAKCIYASLCRGGCMQNVDNFKRCSEYCLLKQV